MWVPTSAKLELTAYSLENATVAPEHVAVVLEECVAFESVSPKPCQRVSGIRQAHVACALIYTQYVDWTYYIYTVEAPQVRGI